MIRQINPLHVISVHSGSSGKCRFFTAASGRLARYGIEIGLEGDSCKYGQAIFLELLHRIALSFDVARSSFVPC